MNPTVGRDVHWFENVGSVPMAAKIVAIHEDMPGVVNLVAWDSSGHAHPYLKVPRFTEDALGSFWDWPAE
jgi:hypothetical protein